VLTTNIPKIQVAPSDFAWLEDECRRLLESCRRAATGGTVLYCPDTQGHYAAMWTRDFCYMVEGAGHLIPPQDIARGIDTLLDRQREDGAIPDRVEPDGTPVYLAGPREQPLGCECPTDNPQFLVKLVSEYVRMTGDRAYFTRRLARLFRALGSVPTMPNGAACIDPSTPHSGYGFTDTVAKTGGESFSTLLLWEAWRLLGKLSSLVEDHDAAHDAHEAAEHTKRSFEQFWSDEFGMFNAATRDCRQIDLWASAYAIRIGAVGSSQRKRIASFFSDLYNDCTLRGYVRHLVAGQYWQRLLVPVPHDTYQNGGYWAVPSGWVVRALLSSPQPELAERLVGDLIAEFRAGGVCEWISASEHALPGYVASGTLLLDAVKPGD
jgi:glycogen debranching enzyme